MRRWILPTTDSSRDDLRTLNPVLAKVLHRRGAHDYFSAQRLLSGVERGGDPFAMLGMAQAVQRIQTAIRRGEMICAYGDFDVDGVTATVLLTQTLRALGAKVQPFIPDRFSEGYGLHVKALRRLRRQGVSLVVTVDCGIRSVREVKAARRHDLDVIVTDHHEPGPILPEALAIINPKQPGCTSNEPFLAGVGVAYRLAQALLEDMPVPWLAAEDLLDLVALGTVADLVPLNAPANRCLARAGLDRMRRSPRPGIRALLREASIQPELICAESIAYQLAPRLNSAGRMAHAALAYELLATNDEMEAYTLAAQLNDLNTARRAATAEALTHAETLLDVSAPALVAADPSFEPGILGLVASQLADSHARPAFVIKQGAGRSRGSGRSHSPAFNVVEALHSCRDLLAEFGGHAGAAGFALNTHNIPALRQRLCELASRLVAEETPALHIDAVVEAGDLNLENAEALAALDPVGMGNPAPVLCVQNLKLLDVAIMGKDESHLRLHLATDEGELVEAVGFGLARRRAELPARVDLAVYLAPQFWKGRLQAQVQVLDFKESEGNP